MKKILAMLLSVAIIATIAITGSVAYLTSTDSDINTMVMGNVKIEQHEKDRDGNDFENNKPLYPMVFENEFSSPSTTPNTNPKTPETNPETGLWTGIVGAQDKIVTVENKGKSPAYVRTWFAFEADNTDSGLEYIHINWNKWGDKATISEATPATINGKTYVVYCVTYTNPLAVGEISEESLLQVGMDRAADNDYVEQFGETYDILVYTQAGQVENMGENAKTALDLMFGTSYPWGTDFEVETDIIIRTADDLKNLGGKTFTKDTKIVLANDIDMRGAKMESIYVCFAPEDNGKVEFIGNNHMISNIEFVTGKHNQMANVGLFEMGSYATTNESPLKSLKIENLTLKDVKVEGKNIEEDRTYECFGAAAVVGYAAPRCEVVLNNVDVYDYNVQNNAGNAAAFVGYTAGVVSMKDCDAFPGTIAGERNDKQGAFMGTGHNATVNFDNCINATGLADYGRNYQNTCTITGTGKSAIIISNKDELIAFANELNGGNINKYINKTVMLTNDIDLNNDAWTPIGNSGTYPTNLTFDGNGHTIKNLNVSRTEGTGDSSTGLFGWTAGAKIKNLTIDGATVAGSHNCGVIVGHADNHNDTTSTIENCHVKNATITCIHDASTTEPKCDCGDKAGAIVGYAAAGIKIKNCTASSCTIKAARDAGQIVGAAKEADVTSCTAADSVTVTADTTGCNLTNAGVNIGGIIGRAL